MFTPTCSTFKLQQQSPGPLMHHVTLSRKHFSRSFKQLHERERSKKREFLQFNSAPSPQLQRRRIRQNDLSTVPLVSSLSTPFLPTRIGRILIFSHPITATAPILQRCGTSGTSSRCSLSRSFKDSYQSSSEDSQQCSRRYEASWVELREEQAGSNCARRP